MTDESGAELDFKKAEFENAGEGLQCSACATGITDRYFQANGQVLCPGCRESLNALSRPEGAAGRAVRAAAFGAIGGALGATVWYAVSALFHLEVGLIAILVGWLVGNGVAKGSGGRGGIGYQVMAAFIAYASIVTTYIPDFLEALSARGSEAPMTAANILALYPIAFAAPFLAGVQNAIGILIIFFALHQAWTLNGKVTLDIQGPFRLKAPGLPAAVSDNS
jgi:hypothetical protein